MWEENVQYNAFIECPSRMPKLLTKKNYSMSSCWTKLSIMKPMNGKKGHP